VYELRKSRKKRKKVLVVAVLLTLAILLGIEYVVMTENNKEQGYRTAKVLADEVEMILESNRRKEETLTESLKESYIIKAKAIAYIIDKEPEIARDFKELQHIASLMSIDEIYLFDDTGKIYSGTIPAHYGYTFDSGEQIKYFKPMLENKTLTMCQDVTPNTAEKKSMMYAISWNTAGTNMVQVGIEPVRLLHELRANRIEEVIATLPSYQGVDILVAERATGGKVLGSTDRSRLQKGRTLKELGIDLGNISSDDKTRFSADILGEPCYCKIRRTEDYVIAVIQKQAEVNNNIPMILGSLLLYLLLAVAVITFIVRRMTRHISQEQRKANTDSMTGLLNRRAYENDMAHLAEDPLRETLTYVAFDLNGLKTANDTLGHEAGDNLLKGAAESILHCFSEYGSLYRTGGDEFIGLLWLDDAQLKQSEKEFARYLAEWTEKHGQELSVSYGIAKAQEEADASLSELAKLADSRMYTAKENYYKNSKKDRRRR